MKDLDAVFCGNLALLQNLPLNPANSAPSTLQSGHTGLCSLYKGFVWKKEHGGLYTPVWLETQVHSGNQDVLAHVVQDGKLPLCENKAVAVHICKTQSITAPAQEGRYGVSEVER